MSIYNQTSYGDSLAQKKRRRFFIRLSIVIAIVVFLGSTAVYALFYSGWMNINSISINGLKTVAEDQISPIVSSVIENGLMPILNIKYRKNSFFFNPQLLKENILAQFPVIKNVKVKKEYPHNINIEIIERVPVGTWCFTDDCSYFDDEGVLWGKAIKSSGSLLLTVEDNRIFPEHQKTVDKVFLENIKKAITSLDGLNIKTSKVVIQPDSINDFFIYTTRGYYIIFSTVTDMAKQIEVLKIFLNEKGQDFKAEYIDLRIEGRVYYK